MERTNDEVDAILEAGLRIHEIGQERGRPLNVTANGRLDLLPGDFAQRYLAQAQATVEDAFTLHHLLGWATNTEVKDLARYAQKHESPITHAQLVGQSAIKEHIDLVVRTGSSGRLSAMMPWHSLDAELYFSPTLFPDFTVEDFAGAVKDYASREPRNDAWIVGDMLVTYSSTRNPR